MNGLYFALTHNNYKTAAHKLNNINQKTPIQIG